MVFEPRSVGQPRVIIRSLIVIGTPSTRPSGAPFTQRASELPGARQRALLIDQAEGVERFVGIGDALECQLRRLDRRDRPAAVGVQQHRGRPQDGIV